MKKCRKRFGQLFAVFALVINLVLSTISYMPVFAEESTISISTAEDLKRLAENCVYDAFSKDKQVVLLNDIDLNGGVLKPIAVFCGVFEGNNHTIRNFRLEEKGSEKGFFIRVAEGAVVRGLNLAGEISVANEKNSQTNAKDTIANLAKTFGLKFNDDTEYARIAGGIAGSNYGTIQGCTFSGRITGEIKVGGIVGENRSAGVVDYCMNTAEVSGDQAVGGVAGSNQGRIESSQNKGAVNKNADVSSTDTGGIAGENIGVIRGCTNEGEVGCLHIGNSAGGIAGKQKGRISACTNYGTVLGRKNVGGIAGRFEPYTDIDLSAEGIRDFVQTGADSIRSDIQDTKDKASSYADALVGDVDQVTGKASGILDDLHEAASGIADTVSGLRGGSGAGELKDGILDMTSSLERLTDRLGGEGMATLHDVLDTFQNSADNLDGMLDGLGAAADEIGDAAKGIDELAGDLSDAVGEGKTDIQDGIDDLQSRLEDLKRLETDYLEPLQDNLAQTHEELQRVLRTLRRSAAEISGAVSDPLERIDRFVEDLSDKIQDMKDDIDRIQKKVEELIEELKEKLTPKKKTSVLGRLLPRTTSTVYAEDEKKVITIEAPIYRNVAGEWVDMAVIDQCYNSGRIEGSSSIGGVAGNVGVESSIKEGENANVTDSALADLKGYVKATIRECITEQSVTAKDGCAGGVAGKAELGWIYSSIGTGDIRVSDGGYAGGIAGSTAGTITQCISIADMEGRNYIGGIAGQGRDISLCYSLPRYSEGIEHSGAIAGTVTGKVTSNYFIQEGLSGVDGADFQDAAVAVPPLDMTGTGTLPEAFSGFRDEDWVMGDDDIYLPQIRALAEMQNSHNSSFLQGKSSDLARFHFRVTFYQDESELSGLTVDYGTVLLSSMIPAMEPRDGFYPQWDQDVTQPIVRNTDFHARYHDATTTIATGENPPLLLVEGNFTERTALTAQPLEWDEDFGYRCKRLAAYSFSISPVYNGKLRVHIRDESGKGNVIGIVSGGGKKLISCERDGSYLIFELDSEQDFMVLRQGHTLWYWLAIFAFGLLLLAAALVLLRIWRMRRPKPPARPPESEMEQAKLEELQPPALAEAKEQGPPI